MIKSEPTSEKEVQEVNYTSYDFFPYDPDNRNRMTLNERFRKATYAGLNVLKRATEEIKIEEEPKFPHLILTNQQIIPQATLNRQAKELSIIVDRPELPSGRIKSDPDEEPLNYKFDSRIHDLNLPRQKSEGVRPLLDKSNLRYAIDPEEISQRLTGFLSNFVSKSTSDTLFKKFVGGTDLRDLCLHPLRTQLSDYSKNFMFRFGNRDSPMQSKDTHNSAKPTHHSHDIRQPGRRFNPANRGSRANAPRPWNDDDGYRNRKKPRDLQRTPSPHFSSKNFYDDTVIKDSGPVKNKYSQNDRKSGNFESDGQWSHDKYFEMENDDGDSTVVVSSLPK